MNKIKVFLFATFKDRVGKNMVEVELPADIQVSEFKKIVKDQFPVLAEGISSMLVAVNKEFAFDDDTIPADAEVALFPPVSGGSEFPTIFKITEDSLDLDSILAEITLPTTGAACFFTGMVRGITEKEERIETKHLHYEAYHPMAEEKMNQVSVEIRSQWPKIEGIAIVQRIGTLLPGTPTVLIACTAGHRDTGVFEAARYGIDRLKQIVPIWKKEFGSKGEVWIEGEYIPQSGDK